MIILEASNKFFRALILHEDKSIISFIEEFFYKLINL